MLLVAAAASAPVVRRRIDGLALALAWAFPPRPVEVELATVTSGPFETTIDEDGKTRLADRKVVFAPLAGKLARVTLNDGDAVAVYTPLAMLILVLPAPLAWQSA